MALCYLSMPASSSDKPIAFTLYNIGTCLVDEVVVVEHPPRLIQLGLESRAFVGQALAFSLDIEHIFQRQVQSDITDDYARRIGRNRRIRIQQSQRLDIAEAFEDVGMFRQPPRGRVRGRPGGDTLAGIDFEFAACVRISRTTSR